MNLIVRNDLVEFLPVFLGVRIWKVVKAYERSETDSVNDDDAEKNQINRKFDRVFFGK
jgi:hypothetical protein